jgi:hypothetical protein
MSSTTFFVSESLFKVYLGEIGYNRTRGPPRFKCTMFQLRNGMNVLRPLPSFVNPYRHSMLRAAAFASDEALLDQFWLSRGVMDTAQRAQLVDLVAQQPTETSVLSDVGVQDILPGMSATWFMDGGSSSSGGSDVGSTAAVAALPQVIAVSRRLLALRQLLGNAADIDIVFMVSREPQLLTADLQRCMGAWVTTARPAHGSTKKSNPLNNSQPLHGSVYLLFLPTACLQHDGAVSRDEDSSRGSKR